MERQFKIIAYLLAQNISIQTGEPISEILNKAAAATEEPKNEVTDDAVERVYKRYPAKCPVRGASTGKCAKNKAQIRRLLKERSEADLIYTIDRYARECIDTQCYMKNFSTFLNQIPDYGEEVQGGLFVSPGGVSRPKPQ